MYVFQNNKKMLCHEYLKTKQKNKQKSTNKKTKKQKK